MFALIFVLGAGQAAFLAVVLAGSKRNRVANRLLAGIIGVVSFDLAMAAFHLAELERSFPHLIGIDFPVAFLYGPLLYLYARTLSNPQHKLASRDLVHSLPFLSATLYSIPFYLLPAHAKLSVLANQAEFFLGLRLDLVSHLKLIVAFGYLVATLVLLRRHRRRIRDRFSSIDRIDLTWLRNVSIGAVVLLSVSIIIYALRATTTDRVIGMEPGGVYDVLTLLSVTAFIYGIGFLGFRQREIEADIPLPMPPEVSDEQPPRPRYARSGLDAETARHGRDTLLAFMEAERPYRSGDLTLGDLAAMLELSPHYLSQVLSTQIDLSFYDFVNGYRVREVQRRLADPADSHLTILALAMEAGFNSKSTFNSAFKKHVGMTPSAYRKHVAAEATSRDVTP